MRVAFVGKGGSGKTTTAAAFSRYLAAQGRPVVAVDADINQHLAAALGHDGPPPRPLGSLSLHSLPLEAVGEGFAAGPKLGDGSRFRRGLGLRQRRRSRVGLGRGL